MIEIIREEHPHDLEPSTVGALEALGGGAAVPQDVRAESKPGQRVTA